MTTPNVARSRFPDSSHGPFMAPRAKLLRAEQFMAELIDEAADYRASSPMTAVFRSGQIDIGWAAITSKPAAIVGDALHNARAALDLAACALVKAHTGSDDGVYFPFAKDSDSLDAAIRSRRLHQVSEELVKAVKARAPFAGGNALLYGLHVLDIQDKHRGVLLTSSRMELHVAGEYHLDGAFEPKVTVELEKFNYRFEEESAAFGGQPVVEVLRSLISEVSSVVDEMEEFLH